jgi:hypothetical protein
MEHFQAVNRTGGTPQSIEGEPHAANGYRSPLNSKYIYICDAYYQHIKPYQPPRVTENWDLS